MRFEFAVAGAIYLLVLFGWEQRPAIDHFPAAVSALVPTLLFFVALYSLVFLSFLVREPFVDHRKVVWERDFREHQIRSIHLRHRAHDWLIGIQNEQRNVSHRGIQMNPGYFDARRIRAMVERLDYIRDQLRKLGQPELADQVPAFAAEQVLDIEDYRRELERCHQLFMGWRSGQELPPFANDASPEGLTIPNFYLV